VPSFVNYKKGCTRLTATSDKVYQLLAHGQWFSPGTLASSTTKTGRRDIAEILLNVALNTKNQSIKSIKFSSCIRLIASFNIEANLIGNLKAFSYISWYRYYHENDKITGDIVKHIECFTLHYGIVLWS